MVTKLALTQSFFFSHKLYPKLSNGQIDGVRTRTNRACCSGADFYGLIGKFQVAGRI